MPEGRKPCGPFPELAVYLGLLDERTAQKRRGKPLETTPLSLLVWIVAGSLLMSALSFSGALTLVLSPKTLERLLLPMVAFAAGALIGGALFFMLPEALGQSSPRPALMWVAVGFSSFFALEQFLHRHHCHRGTAECRRPVTYLILVGDALHNLLDGIAVAGATLADPQLGLATWLAVAAHEIPQEIGDFAVLIHGGWSKGRALALNFGSALTFPVGAVATYFAASFARIDFLVPFAAGAFLYIGASDLIPEVNRERGGARNLVHYLSFAFGLALLLAAATWIAPTAPSH